MRPSLALTNHRDAIRAIALRHRVTKVRVFGSVLHGDDTEDSDLDLLVDPTKDTTMMDIAKIQWELSQLLPVAVDVLTPNGLPAKFRGQVIAEAQAIRAKVMFCVRWITLDTSWRPLTVSTAMLRT